MIDTALTALRRLTGRRSRPTAGLLTADQIKRSLAVARATADRTGQCLSVVVFTPRVPELASGTWVVLAPLLRARLRITDEAGWLDGERVCAVLPFTPTAGAMKVADDVCLLFPDAVPPPVCTVYSYPSGTVPSTGGGSGGDAVPWSSVPDRRGHPADPVPAPAHAPLESLFLQRVSIGKRTVDVIGAAVGLLVLLPLLPLVALAIKLNSPGPVFFKQRRAGWGGYPFFMWKFRTMVADAESRKAALLANSEQDGPAFKIRRDPRVTTVGRFLRTTSIDELPQLWNVLRGEMSLVGPRPLPCGEADRCARWQRRRLDVVPGLTCIWQISGRSAVSFDEWVRMDLEYIETRSMASDLRLLLATVPAVVLRKGAC